MRDHSNSPVRLLTRHFVRRLLDNDLISPHRDRHETLVVLAAVVTTLGLFITFFITSDYLASFDQPPGPTAMSALGDHFLYIAGSMALSALAALLVWDGLALEPRDTAILGPLPISPRVIARAKLAAALVVGVLFTLALNAVPSVLYPAFLTVNLRGIRLVAILQLMAGHALAVVMAGVCGFFGILALRSLLRLLAGPRGFERLSSLVQSTLVVGAVTAVLLAPTVHPADVRDWVSGARAPRWLAVPVLWHLAVHETVAGYVVADTPFVPPPRVPPIPSLIRQDHAAVRAYAALRSRFPPLARRGWLSVPLIVGLAVLSFLWANRRLPERTTRAAGVARNHAVLRELVARLTGRNPETRAGFHFALQVLPRSAPHRTIAAVSLAAGLPLPLIALARAGGLHRVGVASAPLGLLAIQTMILLALLGGLRYAAAVPAELASNWTIQHGLARRRARLPDGRQARGARGVRVPAAGDAAAAPPRPVRNRRGARRRRCSDCCLQRRRSICCSSAIGSCRSRAASRRSRTRSWSGRASRQDFWQSRTASRSSSASR